MKPTATAAREAQGAAARQPPPMIDRGAGYRKMLRGACTPRMRSANESWSLGMAIEVAKVELKSVQDASGLEACIANGQFAADEVIAVIGKTEGNGGVNDFTRILADQAFRRVLLQARQAQRSGRSRRSRWCGRAAATASSRRMPRCLRRNAKTGPANEIAARHRHRDERRASARGHRPAGHGREGRRRGARRHARRRHRRSRPTCTTCRPRRRCSPSTRCATRKRAASEVACEVHESMGVSNGTTGARHRRRARRDQDAEGGADLPRPRPLFVGRVVLLRRGN